MNNLKNEALEMSAVEMSEICGGSLYDDPRDDIQPMRPAGFWVEGPNGWYWQLKNETL